MKLGYSYQFVILENIAATIFPFQCNKFDWFIPSIRLPIVKIYLGQSIRKLGRGAGEQGRRGDKENF
ncbi:hypothetical protein NIES2119_07970 [[Phormidium ambiguum] IAM M-71]|uniref:Uncharacterized protein n=1 Tax=[Phormidium ambiguum] IAM M-71 TaxID=454136 RepID=A0A1U7IP22_9CYAN|nr:hypothetical protein NIES2119_07970 [Phormidium ambiguum IAM M-71]